MEEIRALQKALFEAQQGKAVNRLTDSNTVDLVRLLIDRKFASGCFYGVAALGAAAA